MANTEINDGWRRVGDAVRQARHAMGFNSRDAFAETADVSLRVMADLESGARGNFSGRVLAKVEEALGWPSGTIDRLVDDPNFTPAETDPNGDLMFQPPDFDRRPINVDIPTVERLIAALTEVGGINGFEKVRPELSKLLEAATSLCWPYVVRLVEDNCIPGKQLHPSVTPIYEKFAAVAADFADDDPSGNYTRWLRGDLPDANEQLQQRYMQRWSESRRSRRQARR